MKQYVIKNNFSAGELAPALYTRTDIQQYSNGAKTLTNVIPLIEGGVRKRPGTLYHNNENDAVRLIPFVVNSNDAFILILKPYRIEVLNPRTMVKIASVISPYSAAHIPDVQLVQYRYEMYLTHSAVPVQRLLCNSEYGDWQINEFIYSHVPTNSESARYPFRKGTSSGAALGAFVSFSLDVINVWSSSQAYLIGDVIQYAGLLFQAIRDNTDKQPNVSLSDWAATSFDAGAVFSAADVGNYIEVNGGIIKITQFINANKVSGEVLKKLDAAIIAIERSWSILPPAFNAANGYPRCCTYFKQRLVLANTKKAPNKIWFSAVGSNGDYLETTDDGDAFSVVSASGLANSILFLEAQRGVVCLTSGGEYLVDSDGALSPTTVNISEQSSYGAYPITRPVRVGNELLFVQRGGERLRALTYRFEVDGLVSPEISSLSSHIGEIHGGINEISYQQEPESIVWCVLGDGKVASITFNRDQEVISWAQHDFGGAVKSICSIPTQLGADRAFMLVERKGHICFEEISFDAYLDCQRTVTLTQPSVLKTSLPYIDQYSAYQVDGESIYQVGFNESGISLTFDEYLNGQSVQIGQPFKCVAELFPPELSQNPMSSLLYKAKIDRTGFFFSKTIAPEINGELIELFTFDDNPLDPRKPHTGYHLHEGGSWSDLHQVPMIISHNKPLPFHLQAIAMQMSINEK